MKEFPLVVRTTKVISYKESIKHRTTMEISTPKPIEYSDEEWNEIRRKIETGELFVVKIIRNGSK